MAEKVHCFGSSSPKGPSNISRHPILQDIVNMTTIQKIMIMLMSLRGWLFFSLPKDVNFFPLTGKVSPQAGFSESNAPNINIQILRQTHFFVALFCTRFSGLVFLYSPSCHVAC